MTHNHDENERIVPRFSIQGISDAYIQGVVESGDFNEEFKMKSNVLKRELPFQKQHLVARPPLAVLTAAPTPAPAPVPVHAPVHAPGVDVGVDVAILCTELHHIEIENAQLKAEHAVLKKQIVLQERVISSFCAHFLATRP
tara:strand:+ start:304 stop:726 length:423 start_codon:yes stop_codon:yes gene_type:complete